MPSQTSIDDIASDVATHVTPASSVGRSPGLLGPRPASGAPWSCLLGLLLSCLLGWLPPRPPPPLASLRLTLKLSHLWLVLRSLAPPHCCRWALICSHLAANATAGDPGPLEPQRPCLSLYSSPFSAGTPESQLPTILAYLSPSSPSMPSAHRQPGGGKTPVVPHTGVLQSLPRGLPGGSGPQEVVGSHFTREAAKLLNLVTCLTLANDGPLAKVAGTNS
jgi:hypothetical protein